MTTKWTIGVGIAALIVGSAACRNEPDTVDGPEETTEKTHVDTAQNEHIADLQRRLDVVQAKLDTLDRDMSADMSDAKRKTLKNLRDEHAELVSKLDDAKNASAREWDDMKRDLDRGVDDLENRYDDLREAVKTEREHLEK